MQLAVLRDHLEKPESLENLEKELSGGVRIPGFPALVEEIGKSLCGNVILKKTEKNVLAIALNLRVQSAETARISPPGSQAAQEEVAGILGNPIPQETAGRSKRSEVGNQRSEIREQKATDSRQQTD